MDNALMTIKITQEEFLASYYALNDLLRSVKAHGYKNQAAPIESMIAKLQAAHNHLYAETTIRP
jgi:hypothetical protein